MPASLRVEPACGDKDMKMGMGIEGLAPALEHRDGARPSSDPLKIAEKGFECGPCGGEEEVGKRAFVEEPERSEFVGQGKDDVVVGTG